MHELTHAYSEAWLQSAFQPHDSCGEEEGLGNLETRGPGVTMHHLFLASNQACKGGICPILHGRRSHGPGGEQSAEVAG